MKQECPECHAELDHHDTGYAHKADCPECEWTAPGYTIYDMAVFSEVKWVQREVGQQAAERVAAEYNGGALAE